MIVPALLDELETNANAFPSAPPVQHRRRGRRAVLLAAAAAAAALLTEQPLGAKDDIPSKSAPLAQALSKQLDQGKLQYIAARDPSEDGRYVAAMHMAAVQIYVISAKYSAPELLREKLITGKYQEIYVDLTSASERTSRISIEDLRANGLARARQKDPPFDVYESAGKRVIFDYDWRKQKLTQEDYLKTLETADELYSRVLGLLLNEAKKPR